jgi:hypothetical protein
MRLPRIPAALLLGALLLSPAPASAQEEFYHPELEWKTIETPHFMVHYHQGAERTGRVIAKIAEEIYGPVTALYEHVPDSKVNFIVKDVDDISNGAAYFYENRIEIYAPSMDFDLRGTHNWLRNVVTHEFTHIVQIQASMKFGRTVPAFYLQWLQHEAERRQDVLYGFPNVIVSYPWSGFVVPAWFAEGTAQYNRGQLRYDFWDSHRDMILRSYALDSSMLTWKQMSVFGKTSLGNESSYNAGFSFVAFIGRTYGDDKLREISRNLGRFATLTIDDAIERTLGKPGQQVYDEWKEELQRDYAARVAPVRANLKEGTPLVVDEEGRSRSFQEAPFDEKAMGRRDHLHPARALDLPCCSFRANTGFANMYPAWSPDGTKLAYVSTKNADYFSQSSLFVYDFATGKETLVQSGVRTDMSWSPDGSRLYYARSTRDNPHWSYQFDIYVYDLREEEETRLTRGRRAISPSVSPDGRSMVFVVTKDGTSNLVTAAVDGSGERQITTFTGGEQVYNPQWNPAGDRIAFDYSVRDGRDLATIAPDGGDLRWLVTGPDDARSPAFTPDGSRILFSSDRTGIFNIYSVSAAGGTPEQLTNVVGGAFMPTVNPAGRVGYAGYTSTGYKIYLLDAPGTLPDDGGGGYLPSSVAASRQPSGTSLASGGPADRFDWEQLRSYDDTDLPATTPRPYKSVFSSVNIVPFLRIDNYNPKNTALELLKPGIYIFSNEILDKLSFFATGAMNVKLERDLFLQASYRGKLPPFWQIGLEPVASVELYNVTRKTEAPVTLPLDTMNVDVQYSFFGFDFVLTHPLFSRFGTAEFRYNHSRYTSDVGSFVLPESGYLVQGTSDLYLIANIFSLTLRTDMIVPASTAEISPVGRKIALRVDRELNQFLDRYQFENGLFVPQYEDVNFTRLELNWREHLPFFFAGHTLGMALRAATILAPPVDEYFDFYAGGMAGMRGYPYYSLGGNDLLAARLTYRFPLVRNIDWRFLQIYFDKLYASVFMDAGNAWTVGSEEGGRWRKDVGFEIRLETFSFYAYPTRIFFSGAYGLDRFSRYVPSRAQTVTYGQEWLFYFGILFGFDLD